MFLSATLATLAAAVALFGGAFLAVAAESVLEAFRRRVWDDAIAYSVLWSAFAAITVGSFAVLLMLSIEVAP